MYHTYNFSLQNLNAGKKNHKFQMQSVIVKSSTNFLKSQQPTEKFENNLLPVAYILKLQ